MALPATGPRSKRNYSLNLAISEMNPGELAASFFRRRMAAVSAFDVLEKDVSAASMPSASAKFFALMASATFPASRWKRLWVATQWVCVGNLPNRSEEHTSELQS